MAISLSSPPYRSSTVRDSPLESAAEIPPRLGITKRRLKQVESICLIREQRASGCQELAFNARPFVLCGLPPRRPSATELVHRRRNGKFFLHVVAHPNFGLPYGQDRLLPIWVATLSVQQKTREIHFSSAAQILDFFDLPKDGPHYRRMVEGFQRIFAASIFFGTRDHVKGTSFVDVVRFQFFDRMKLWFNAGEQPQPDSGGNFDNAIILSEAFYAEIRSHPIPVERHVVAALANAPGVLDFYMWLVWRTWTINTGSVSVPLVAERGLNEQLGSERYTEPRFFRAKVRGWLRQVKALWPECPSSISPDGLSIQIQSSRANPAILTAAKAVNH
jgi:Plasmid encoded RepA protein